MDTQKYYLKPLLLSMLTALYGANVTALEITNAQTAEVIVSTADATLTVTSSGSLITAAPVDDGRFWSVKIESGVTDAELTNEGRINCNCNASGAIWNFGGMLKLDNSNEILSDYQGVQNIGTITNFTNSGRIETTATSEVGGGGTTVLNVGDINTLNNSGEIIGTFRGIANNPDGTIGILNNTGTISATSQYGVINFGNISLLSNTGTITSDGLAGVYNSGTITTLANMGNITGTSDNINNYSGVIGTLINAQGNGNALTYRGNLPSTYKIFIASPTDYGQLSITSTATFAVRDLDFSSLTFDIAEGSTLQNITYDSVISNGGSLAFTGTADKTGTYLYDGTTWDWTLVFDGVNWDLGVIEGPGGSANSPLTPLTDATLALGNTASSGAARAIDASPELLALFTGTEQQLSDDVESTLPGVSGGVSQMTNIATNAVTGVVAARQDLTRGLSSGDGFMTDRHIWFKPFGGWTEQDSRQGVNGYDIDSYGLAVGFDGDVSSAWNVGVALAYINSDVESSLTSGSHSIDMDSYMAKVYATKMIDDVTALNLQVGAGVSDYDSQRRIFTGDIANADYDSWNLQLSAELERSYQLNDKTVVTPYIHADYSYVNVEDYSESGAGALNLNVDDDSSDSLIIGAGVKGNYNVSDSLLLLANAGVGYDVMTDRSSLTSSFAGGGAQFTTEGIKPDEVTYNAGVGAKYSLENGTEITASYNVDARQDYTDQSLSANFRFMF